MCCGSLVNRLTHALPFLCAVQVDPDEVARLQERLEAGEELDLNKVSAATNAAAKAAMDSRFNT